MVTNNQRKDSRLSHPVIADRQKAKRDSAFEEVQAEANDLFYSGTTSELIDIIAHSLWLVDNTFCESEAGHTFAREGDIQDLTMAVEELRRAGA
jgi:hypothetical protein